MFTKLANSNNEFQFSILEILLITRHKPEFCIQKQFYTPLLSKNPIGPCEENIITLLAYEIFYQFSSSF